VKAGGRPALKESEVRLQRVLDVAKRNFLFADLETSLDDIARESGIAKKAIYSRFGCKAGLFSAIIQPLRQSRIAELQDIVIESKRPESMLEAAALQLLDVSTRAEMIELQRLLLVESRRFPDLIDGQHMVLGGFRERMPHGVAKRPDASTRTRVAKQAVRIFLAGCRLQ
jgi:AcrR family transcriptional regulator